MEPSLAEPQSQGGPDRDTDPDMTRNPRYDVIPVDVDGVLQAINNGGECVGHWITSNGAMHAIHLSSAGVTDLGTLGGSASSARGISNAGSIVGGALTEGDVSYHAFFYQAGVMHDLNCLISSAVDCELIQALGINDHGDIIAYGHYDGADRLLLLKRRDQQR